MNSKQRKKNLRRELRRLEEDLKRVHSILLEEQGIGADESAGESEYDTIEITEFLLKLGMSPQLKGYQYVRYAIELYADCEGILQVYENVAKAFNTTAQRVEDCIRYAIRTRFTEMPEDLKKKLFWSSRKQAPKNSQFVARVVQYLQQRPR